MFSVVLATRNRPKLFQEALSSVLMQSDVDLEILVVNDGTGDAAEYKAIEASADPRLRFLHLPYRPRGHGQSYALNTGALAARHPYLCFLDDDDVWIKADYLASVQRVISKASGPVDLHMANQIAYLGDAIRPGPIWIEGLVEILERAGEKPDASGAYTVNIQHLLASPGFCHVNTLIVRRSLYLDIGGMDEGIRWECDRDLFLRLIERAQIIRFSPIVASRHNIPAPAAASSMTTSISMLQKRLYQLMVFEKASALGTVASIRAYGRKNKGYTLKKISEELASQKRDREALWYACQALAALPTIKWAVFTVWLGLRTIVALGNRKK